MSTENNDFLSRGCAYRPKPFQKNEHIYCHSCSKRNAYAWLDDIEIPHVYAAFPFAEVRFKNSRKEFFRLPEGLDFVTGDIVAVESSPGHDIGIITLLGENARLQMKKKKVSWENREFKKIYRRARPSDLEKWVSTVSRETTSLSRTRKIAGHLRLSMKMNDVEYQGDGTKATFYYTAEERVDFRELIKLLADEFGVRIEMRQIGVRQEASSLGGIGTCGRELCCATWLHDFKSVSTNTARVQQLSINPQKLAGQCSKLKCCLNYEYEAYVDALHDFPTGDAPLKTKRGNAILQKTDVFQRLMWYSYADDPANLMAIPVDEVKKIQKSIAKGVIPDKLEDYARVKEKKTDFEHIEEDLNRFNRR